MCSCTGREGKPSSGRGVWVAARCLKNSGLTSSFGSTEKPAGRACVFYDAWEQGGRKEE
jgi:hypothetical protein